MKQSAYIKNLNYRYATKKFDSSKDISNEHLEELKKVIQLSASSYGLQPYEVLIIKDKAIREKLKSVSYNQSQITDASYLLVFCTITNLGQQHIDNYMQNMIETREVSADDVQGFKEQIEQTVSNLDPNSKQNWAEKQIYIALGNLLSAAPFYGIDACPMEGFENDKYNEILGLKEKNLHATVIATIGYRSDEDHVQHLAKVRKPQHELFTEI